MEEIMSGELPVYWLVLFLDLGANYMGRFSLGYSLSSMFMCAFSIRKLYFNKKLKKRHK